MAQTPVSPFVVDQPEPELIRRLLDFAKQRKKAGVHVLKETATYKALVLTPLVPSTHHESDAQPWHGEADRLEPTVEVVCSMLDQGRLAKRKAYDDSKAVQSTASDSTRAYFSCSSSSSSSSSRL